MATRPADAGSERADATSVNQPSDASAAMLADAGVNLAPGTPSPSTGCGRGDAESGELELEWEDLTQPYHLSLPPDYEPTVPTPLVFAFHGLGRSHMTMRTTDSPDLERALLEQTGAIVVFGKSVGVSWDEASDLEPNLQQFDALRAHLLSNYCVDTQRVFAVGHSSGAYFTTALACTRSEQLRGIAVVAGSVEYQPCAARQAAIIIHGERDSVIPRSLGWHARETFRQGNGCTSSTVSGPVPECVRHTGCHPELPLVWCEHAEPTYEDTNHGWPSFGSKAISQFFDALAVPPMPTGTALVSNPSFEQEADPWQLQLADTAMASGGAEDGAYCATVERAGENPWDVQLQTAFFELREGKRYQVDLRAWASKPTLLRVQVGRAAAPYDEVWVRRTQLVEQPRRLRDEFVMATASHDQAGFGLQFGGPLISELPVRVCFDEVHLTELP